VVFEEGDLQHLSILPVGSVNITNDLAIGLRTDLDVAEDIKIKHVSKVLSATKDKIKNIEYQQGDKKIEFSAKDIKMIVEARLDEIFEMIDKELSGIDKSGKLPGGVILTGAGANLTDIAEYAKDRLRLPARVAHNSSINGMSDKVSKPDFATALGLMLLDLESSKPRHRANKVSGALDGGGKMFGKLLNSAGDFMRRFRP
jgi:cell division protein FtsA